MEKKLKFGAPWHKASYEMFLNESLPALLASRLPLTGYRVEVNAADYACQIVLELTTTSGDFQISYPNLPFCDEEGFFNFSGKPGVVYPLASTEELDLAEIRCVGEQLHAYLADQLGEAPTNLPWDGELVRSWLPLEQWVSEFFEGRTIYSAGVVAHRPNWLERHAQLTRIEVTNRQKVFTEGQIGRTCPFETPEGPNVGRYLHLAAGAQIREGHIVIVDESPAASLGMRALIIPFIESDEPARLLMGTNMLRQWLIPPDPEPALVQTGYEPEDDGSLWCGRNLLTAFVSWGADTFEDGIVISQSCANRLNFGGSVEPGDKLSNRHGSKGTISKILPDDQMPHLADGTPVDLVFDFLGVQTRLNFGQIKEAVISRIAMAEGAPAIVPPFKSSTEVELHEQLKKAGLAADGMEKLYWGQGGPTLAQSSTVGWIYWGKLHHQAQEKMQISLSNVAGGITQGELEYLALRKAGALEFLLEQFNTRSSQNPQSQTLAASLSAGSVKQAAPPTPKFDGLVRKLAVMGIAVESQKEDEEIKRLKFTFAAPITQCLKLVMPVNHPWLKERKLAEVGVVEGMEEYASLVEANLRLERVIKSQAPASLLQSAHAQLQHRVNEFAKALLGSLLTEENGSYILTQGNERWLEFSSQVIFGGSAVLSPGSDLRLDEVGIGQELAWSLYGPLVKRELGGSPEVDSRSARALEKLAEIMARSWVVINRKPSTSPTSFIAFHPVRYNDRVIRIHPLVCRWLDADFDGDQANIFLPITELAQEEVGEKLSVTAHLRREPALLQTLIPRFGARWGLAYLSLSEEGRSKINEAVGIDIADSTGFVSGESLYAGLRTLMDREGIVATLEVLEKLNQLGFEVARLSGASIHPFIGESLAKGTVPTSDDPHEWRAYTEEMAERMAVAGSNFEDIEIGSQLLAIVSGARGNIRGLNLLANLRGPVKFTSGGGSKGRVSGLLVSPELVGQDETVQLNGRPVIVRHSYREGYTPTELLGVAIVTREGLARNLLDMEHFEEELVATAQPTGLNVLARARRSRQAGLVFALAAAREEVDPLTDPDSRLFVGLLPKN